VLHRGPSLLQYLDAMPILDRKNNAPLMMPISEKYSDMGTVVVGKVESGHVKKGQSLLLMPNKVRLSPPLHHPYSSLDPQSAVVVAAIHNEMEEEVPMAVCGDNVRIRLRGVEDEEIGIGFVLTSVEAPVHAVTHFEAQLVILDHKNIICAGYSAVMHVHTLAEEINLSVSTYRRCCGLSLTFPSRHCCITTTRRLARSLASPRSSPRRVGPVHLLSLLPLTPSSPGQKIIALIEAAAPVCIERFADHPQLGRFTIRDEGKTIAIGKVTKLITSVVALPDLAKLDLENGA
jgi:peptide chain release factor subunit 3